MDDALPPVELVVVLDAELPRVVGERLHLHPALGIVDPEAAVRVGTLVDHRQRLLRRAHLPARHPEPLERLRARHFVHEVAVDVEQAGAVGLAVDDVVVEDLVVERLGRVLGHRLGSLEARACGLDSAPVGSSQTRRPARHASLACVHATRRRYFSCRAFENEEVAQHLDLLGGPELLGVDELDRQRRRSPSAP